METVNDQDIEFDGDGLELGQDDSKNQILDAYTDLNNVMYSKIVANQKKHLDAFKKQLQDYNSQDIDDMSVYDLTIEYKMNMFQEYFNICMNLINKWQTANSIDTLDEKQKLFLVRVIYGGYRQLFKYLKLTRQGPAQDYLAHENTLAKFGYRIITPTLNKVTKDNNNNANKRSYKFSDHDFLQARQRLSRSRTSPQMIRFMSKLGELWHSSSSFDDFVVAIQQFFQGDQVMMLPLQEETIINWLTKLCVQQYLMHYFETNMPENELSKDADKENMHQKERSKRILARAKGYAAINPGDIVPPDITSRDYWAWSYWIRQKKWENDDLVQMFVKQWVLLGPNIFKRLPINFGSGGRYGYDEEKHPNYYPNAMTMPKLKEFIDALAKNPGASIHVATKMHATKDSTSDPNKTVYDNKGNKYKFNVVREFLNRIGIRHGRAFTLDQSARRKTSVAEELRFKQYIQERYVFGLLQKNQQFVNLNGRELENADVMWMDETSLSLFPSHKWAWGFEKRQTQTTQAKKTSGGEYNMMLTLGLIGGKSFVHYMIYKPQREHAKRESKVFDGNKKLETVFFHGKLAKVMGTYGSILNYLFGTWNSNDNLSLPENIRCSINTPEYLAKLIKKLRANRDDKNIPLYFFWDNLAGHFGKSVRHKNETDIPPKKPYNPAHEQMKSLFASAGIQNVNMTFVPRHMPQYNPCERVFAHLKGFISRKAKLTNSHINPTEMLLLVEDYIKQVKDNGIINIIHGCHYYTTFKQAHSTPKDQKEFIERPTKEQQKKWCNEIYPWKKPDKNFKGQLVCYSPKTNVIAKYLPPDKHRWHILSQQTVLFENDLEPMLIPSFDNVDAKHHVTIETATKYAVFNPGLPPDTLTIDEQRDKDSHVQMIQQINDCISTPKGESDHPFYIPIAFTWFTIVRLCQERRTWKLHPHLIKQNTELYLMWEYMENGNESSTYALMRSDKQTTPIKVNLFLGQEKSYETMLIDFDGFRFNKPAKNQIIIFTLKDGQMLYVDEKIMLEKKKK
jgi:hypothetical protein